jgi:RimJ/RimL family protein N-acetyltransferase
MLEKQLKNGRTVILREAKIQDAQKMAEYLQKLSLETDFLTFGPGEFTLTVEDEEKMIRSKAETANQLLLCAFIDGELVGNLSFTAASRPRIRHTGELGVSVLQAYWGQGIATELIRYLLEWAKEGQIIRKVNLRVRSDHQVAIALYKKLGFTQEGIETRGLYIAGQFFDFIHMGLPID